MSSPIKRNTTLKFVKNTHRPHSLSKSKSSFIPWADPYGSDVMQCLCFHWKCIVRTQHAQHRAVKESNKENEQKEASLKHLLQCVVLFSGRNLNEFRRTTNGSRCVFNACVNHLTLFVLAPPLRSQRLQIVNDTSDVIRSLCVVTVELVAVRQLCAHWECSLLFHGA